MGKYTIFYSWQSETNVKLNSNFISSAIEKAITKQKKEVLEIEISLDRDTRNIGGAPNITETILRKISTSDIFICDVTPTNVNVITNLLNIRRSPNANVLLELGYALKTIGSDRVICILNTNYGNPDKLPFNLRHMRILRYELKNIRGRENEFPKLVNTIDLGLKTIINNYPEIIKKNNEDNTRQFDIRIYQRINKICGEQELYDSLDFTVNNATTNSFFLNRWDKLENFARLVENKFIAEDLNNYYIDFVSKLSEFNDLTATYFHSIVTPGQKYFADYEESEITEELRFEIEWSTRYKMPKEPVDGNWERFETEYHETLQKLLTKAIEVKKAYSHFRNSIKQKLFI